MRGWCQWWRQKSPPARRMSNPRKWRRKRCRPAMQRKSTKTDPGVVNAGAQDGCADSALAIRFADVEVWPVQFELLGRRSADPHSPMALANWEPAPAAVVVVVGINASQGRNGWIDGSGRRDGTRASGRRCGNRRRIDRYCGRRHGTRVDRRDRRHVRQHDRRRGHRAPSRWSGRELRDDCARRVDCSNCADQFGRPLTSPHSAQRN